MLEKAKVALEEAFADQVKTRFATLCANAAGGEELEEAAGHFEKGMIQIKAARERAASILERVFES